MGFFDDIDAASPAGVVQMLNILYASEIIAAEQYWSHGVAVEGPNSLSVQEMFYGHADDEMKHAGMLRDRIHNLGGRLANTLSQMKVNNTKLGGGADVAPSEKQSQMLIIDLMGEETAIKAYTEACGKVMASDPATYVTLAEILRDEFDHAQDIKNLQGQAK